MPQMRKLMDDDIVYRLGRVLHEPERERYPPLAAAAAEARPRAGYRYARGAQPHQAAVILDPAGQILPRRIPQALFLLRTYLRLNRPCPLKLRLYPVLMRGDEAVYLALCKPPRCADKRSAVTHRERQTAPVRPYEFIIDHCQNLLA